MVGFPIVACCFMGWFCYKMLTKINDTMTEVQLAMGHLADSIDGLTREVENKI